MLSTISIMDTIGLVIFLTVVFIVMLLVGLYVQQCINNKVALDEIGLVYSQIDDYSKSVTKFSDFVKLNKNSKMRILTNNGFIDEKEGEKVLYPNSNANDNSIIVLQDEETFKAYIYIYVEPSKNSDYIL